jgi:maltokinase
VTNPESTSGPRIDAAGLGKALRAWLPERRWFGGKGRPIKSVKVVTDTCLRESEPSLHHVLIEVAYRDGEQDLYQVPVGIATTVPEELAGVEIGPVSNGAAYDALHDADFSRLLLRLIADDANAYDLAFRRGLPTSDGTPLNASLHGRALGTEQSNSSLLYGESYVLKVFRRIVPGVNPDLEITRALALEGLDAVPRPLGWIEGPVRGVDTTFALLQPYLRLATDGWALATTSVRDLFAEADLHADEVGGDFASESERLGSTTAHVHAALSRSFATETAGRTELWQMATAMTERVHETAAAVAELQPYAEPLRAAFAELAALDEAIAVQRIHGDYHLGQVLRTDTGWTVLDFEGEPAKPLAARVALDSPLRDVAGMLRSFDYASRHLLTDSQADAQLEYRATEWAERNREAFCDGYTEAAGADPRKAAVLLRSYELDKAVYEVLYEARNRPSWLPIPLAAIERLVT